MQDDADLLIRFSKDESNDAFAELVRRHLNFVYATALRQVAGDTHMAEDVAQSVFSDLARKAKAIADCPILARWLYTSTHYAAAKAVRSEQRRRTRERVAQAMHDDSSDPAYDVEWARIRPSLDEALLKLSQQDRDAIFLRFFEARSFAAIGAKLGLNENAVRMRVDRALDKLRVYLSRRGIASSATALALILSNEAAIAAPAGLAMNITDAALASTAGGSGATATLLKFMSTTKLTLSVAGLAAVAAILGISAVGIGINQLKAAHHVEAEVQETEGELKGSQEQLFAFGKDVVAADKEVATLRQPTANSRPSPRTSQSRLGSQPTNRDPSPSVSQREDLSKFLTAVPQARGILEGIFQTEAAARYGPFFKSTNMSPVQIEQFENAVVNTRLGDLALTPSGFSDTSALLPPDDQLQALLGNQNYQQFKDFLQVQPAYSLANFAGAAAGLASEPLSADQEDQLVQVLIKNASVSQAGGPIDLSTLNWDVLLPQAQGLVSPSQWNALQGVLLQMQYRQALQAAQEQVAATVSAKNN
jgi:RNA polymerase sigma factor (sigma-70 family)